MSAAAGGTAAGAGSIHKAGNVIEESGNSSTLRQKAVSDAWKKEQQLVLQGKGTRDWTLAQQTELLTRGKVSGFEGQHMKDVKHYPRYAGDANNIQFLPEGSAHFQGAHGKSYKDGSNGWFNEETGEIVQFGEDELAPAPIVNLTSRLDPVSIPFTSGLSAEFGYGGTKREDYSTSKQKYKGKKSVKSGLNS